MENFIITFYSTHLALKAEKVLNKMVMKIDLIPTPREISSECGFTLLIHHDNRKAITDQLTENEIVYDEMYIMTEINGAKKYEKTD